MNQLNGKALAPRQEEPKTALARMVYNALAEDGDAPFAQLGEDERDQLEAYAEHFIAAHVQYLMDKGIRLLPPGAAPVPRTEAEAMAMLQAAKGFFDAQRRAGKVVNVGAKGPLIIPGRKH